MCSNISEMNRAASLNAVQYAALYVQQYYCCDVSCFALLRGAAGPYAKQSNMHHCFAKKGRSPLSKAVHKALCKRGAAPLTKRYPLSRRARRAR